MKKFPSFQSIEILLTVCIFVIISGVSITSFTSFWQNRHLEMLANQLMQDIEFVRSLALEKRESLRMEFYGAGNYYRFETNQAGMAKNNQYILRSFDQSSGFPYHLGISPVSYTDETGSLVQGSINFSVSSSETYGALTFNASGTPSTGGHIILFSKRCYKGLVIIIKPVTGRVRIGRVIIHY